MIPWSSIDIHMIKVTEFILVYFVDMVSIPIPTNKDDDEADDKETMTNNLNKDPSNKVPY